MSHHKTTAVTFDSEVAKASEGNPEVIMLVSYPETGGLILKTAYEKGVMENIKWLLSEGLRSDDLAEIKGITLKIKEITKSEWRTAVSGMVKAEENTKELEAPAETLFGIASDIIKDLNLYMLSPTIHKDEKLFRGVAKFYGVGTKELKYAAQIEVVGGAKKSKLILKAWAEREDALTGFYHKKGKLDELEKRINLKDYIDDTIVQHIVNISGSVVQRSQIVFGDKK